MPVLFIDPNQFSEYAVSGCPLRYPANVLPHADTDSAALFTADISQALSINQKGLGYAPPSRSPTAPQMLHVQVTIRRA
jgi:hypothetical protein